TAADEFMHQDILLLPDSEGPIGGLILDRRVPPAVEMDDMGRRRQVEARSTGLEREHEERVLVALLKSANQSLALRDGRPAMQHEAGPAEDAGKECFERCGRLLELGEDEGLFLPARRHLGDIAQACELAAVRLDPGAVAKPVRGMIADLLEADEEGQ